MFPLKVFVVTFLSLFFTRLALHWINVIFPEYGRIVEPYGERHLPVMAAVLALSVFSSIAVTKLAFGLLPGRRAGKDADAPEQVVRARVRQETAVPLIAPVVMLILGCIFIPALFFGPPDLKRDWSAVLFFVGLGCVFLGISLTFFAVWFEQQRRKANAGEGSTDD